MPGAQSTVGAAMEADETAADIMHQMRHLRASDRLTVAVCLLSQVIAEWPTHMQEEMGVMIAGSILATNPRTRP